MDKQRTLLIVDDSPIDRMICSSMFEGIYSIMQAESGEAALETMRQGHSKIDIVLLDISMPGMNGLEVIDAMKADEALKRIPIVVATSETDHEQKALEVGADDFVTKPFAPLIVKKRVANILDKYVLEREKLEGKLLSAERQLYKQQQQLLYNAEHDALTRICNRTAFLRRTREQLAQSNGQTYIMVQFDISRFKVINELYGSEHGDGILKTIANVLTEHVQGRGTFCRLESDRFAACLPYSREFLLGGQEALEAAVTKANNNIPPALYYGLYVIEPGDDTAVEIMCDHANTALQSVKGDYNKRFAYYDEEMHASLMNEYRMREEAARGLRDGEFEPFFQPVFDLRTGKLASAEALVRWRHPERGLVSPGLFIPLFENNGLILHLGEYMRESVSKFIADMGHRGIECPPVSVNLSRLEMYDAHSYGTILDLTREYGIKPEQLRLEITESAYADDLGQLLDATDLLRSQGFKILMDDFGSGYSSLSLLRDISIDFLKLDMRFLEGGSFTERADAITGSVISLAKTLEIPVIAEGVETAEHEAALKKADCEYVQGFRYARPMPAGDYIELLQKQ